MYLCCLLHISYHVDVATLAARARPSCAHFYNCTFPVTVDCVFFAFDPFSFVIKMLSNPYMGFRPGVMARAFNGESPAASMLRCLALTSASGVLLRIMFSWMRLMCCLRFHLRRNIFEQNLHWMFFSTPHSWFMWRSMMFFVEYHLPHLAHWKFWPFLRFAFRLPFSSAIAPKP